MDVPATGATPVLARIDIADDPPAAYPLAGRGGLMVGMLLLVNIVNFVDRQLPFILIGSIKKDLLLSDAQIGLMAGLTFAIVYSVAALPLAHAADRWSPRWVLVLSLATWSGMTALSGLAQTFTQLVFGRIGVAASEAGCTPSAHALIVRIIAPRRRALALALFSIGVPIGSTLGLILGGWINDVADWRTAFFVVGLPGLGLALLAWLILPKLPGTEVAGSVAPPGFGATLHRLFALRSFRYMAAGSAFYSSGSYAINVFAPAFLMRVHGLTASQAGLRMGIVFGVGGLIGTFVGGVLADRLARRDEAWRQYLPAIGQWVSLPLGVGAWLAPDLNVATALLATSYMMGLLYFAPTFAAVQSLVPDRIRATASAVLLFCLTIVGSSVGPLVVGWLSDLLTPRFGALSLRYALCSMAVTMALSGISFQLAGRSLAGDIRRSI
ncbi:spinster family MFS transporter [uncultured Sphingomonas sp.]|uniref:spinster family MFS transporter n=1 Tax=uncultured Sphingomonas sp. TaxID=158754 RepID=UPI0035C9AD2A